MRKIILLGYMGCGKSTIAQKLAKTTGLPFLDLDQCIEERMNLSVNEIFEKKGEIYFRKLEHQIFDELLNSSQEIIIGLGGGTPCYANNHELFIGKNRTSIYLKASIDTLFERLHRNKSKRPLIANKTDSELKEFIAMHLFERSFYYTKASNTVVVDDKSVDDTVTEIKALLA